MILFMDDWGTSDKTYLSDWHYKTPMEKEMLAGLIEPLQKHHGVIDMNVNTGFVDRKTRRIVTPWKQRVVDEIDGKTIHDSLDEAGPRCRGGRRPVLHPKPRLDPHAPRSGVSPGPFWDVPMDGVGSLDWYNEFGDNLRKHEMPAAMQKQAHGALDRVHSRDFEVVPQVIRPGGSLYSKSFANNTAGIAARMGFGIATWDWAVYLGKDMALSLESVSRRKPWVYNQRLTAADIPWSIDAPFWLSFHDRDLAMDHAPSRACWTISETASGT